MNEYIGHQICIVAVQAIYRHSLKPAQHDMDLCQHEIPSLVRAILVSKK